MAVERNLLSGIPTGNSLPANEEMEVEIDLEEPGMEELMGMGAQSEMLPPQDHYANLAELLDEDTLKELGEDVVESYSADKESREEWESTFERGFDLLGLKLQETTEPFEGSCTAVSPLIIESAVKFQSKATIEMFPSGGPVRTQIVGSISPEREDQANRVQNFMNYQFTEQISEYFDEFEKMLFHLPLIGSAFKKMYYDPSMRRPCSEFVPVDQFYVSYNAPDLQKAERYTHVIFRTPNEMDREVINGMYMDVDLGEATAPDPNQFTSKIDNIMGISPAENYDEQYTLLEQHCQRDLPAPLNNPDGLALPYVITVEENSKKVIAIRRNWSKEDPTQTKQTYFTHYKFVPGFGFYGLGLIHLLGNLTMSATSALRSLVDAGQFSNLPGGFKARGVRVVGSNDPIAPGEFREVEATGLDLQKSIVPLPYKEPSQTLYNMLNFLTTTGQKFADSTEQIVNESSNYGPVGTTMALIESSAKFFSAIHKRLHKSQRDEFRILAKINYEFLPDEYPYDVPNITSSVFKSDFDGRVDVIPVSDPNVPSAAHRLAMAQMVLQLSSQAPQGMYNLQNVHMSILKAANIQNPERFFIPPEEPKPQDPIADIQSVVKGLPIKAFPQQDHEAHIAIKTAFIEDPTLGKTEMMAPAVPVLQANIQEHMVMKYQEQMSGMMQLELQQTGQDSSQVSPEVLSKLSIDAAEKVLQASEGQGGGVGAIEQQNLRLEAARLDLEQKKIQLGATKDAAELALQNRELDIKELSINQDHKIRALKDAGDLKAKVDDSIRSSNAKIAVENIKKLVKERELLIKSREKEKRYNKGGPVRMATGGTGDPITDFIMKQGGSKNQDPLAWLKLLEKVDDIENQQVAQADQPLLGLPSEQMDMGSVSEEFRGLPPEQPVSQEFRGSPPEQPVSQEFRGLPPEQLQQKGNEVMTGEAEYASALDLVKGFEGFRSDPYHATEHEKEKGILTVGYGDTQSGKKSVTEEEATEDLVERLNKNNEVIDESVIVDLNRGQRESLLSLIDNVGEGAFKKSKGLKKLNEGDYEGAMTEFFDADVGFTKQNGKQLAGLVRRRQAEQDLWTTG